MRLKNRLERTGRPRRLRPLRPLRRLARLGALLPLACGLGASGVEAQIRFGPKAGISVATMSAGGGSVDEGRVGLTLGAFVEIPFQPLLVFQPEVYYTQKGVTTSEPSYVPGSDPPALFERRTDYRYQYVELAALLHIKTRAEPVSGRWGFLVGPVVSHQLSGSRTSPASCFQGQWESMDFGLLLGTSFEGERAVLELRYQGLGRRLERGATCTVGRHQYGALVLGFRI